MSEFKTFEDMKHDIPEGATHYQDENDEFSFAWFNSKEGRRFVRGRWVECSMSDYPDGEIKAIPVVPQTKRTSTEYEKVTESIFDLRDEFERGELYMKLSDELLPVPNETQLSILLDHKQCYRKVEKEIDWREEVSAWVQENQSVNIDFLTNSVMYYHGSVSNDTFLEMCRVALRANGEIE